MNCVVGAVHGHHQWSGTGNAACVLGLDYSGVRSGVIVMTSRLGGPDGPALTAHIGGNAHNAIQTQTQIPPMRLFITAIDPFTVCKHSKPAYSVNKCASQRLTTS